MVVISLGPQSAEVAGAGVGIADLLAQGQDGSWGNGELINAHSHEGGQQTQVRAEARRRCRVQMPALWAASAAIFSARRTAG